MLEKFLITSRNYSAILANPARLAEHNITKIYLRDRNLPLSIFRAFLELNNVEIFVNHKQSPEILAHKNIHLKSDELHLAKELKKYDLIQKVKATSACHSEQSEESQKKNNRDSSVATLPQNDKVRINYKKTLSYSAHSLEDILNAHKAKIDYIFISPIFAVENKNPPLGVEFLAQIPREIRGKIFALGGINSDNIKAFENLGIAGIAGIRIFSAFFNK